MRQLFKVVTKAAIFNADRTRVLVIHMDQNDDYGLPGGHVEANEELDATMQRELLEECGIKAKDLRKAGFFFHSNGKIVLAYIGEAESEDILSQQDNLEGIPKWLTREQFENLKIEPNYRELVIDNWS